MSLTLFSMIRISDKDLLEVADRFAIGTAERVLKDVKSVFVNT